MNLFKDLISIDIKKDMGIYNLTDEFFCLYLNEISQKEKRNILVVVNSIYEANKLYDSLSNYANNVFLFPMDDFLTSEALATSPDLKLTRLDTLNRIISSDNNIIITNLMGYLRYLPTEDIYKSSILNLKVGDTINPKVLVEKLSNLGYNRDTLVTKTGEYGVRGFIIDVYPIDEEKPIRIEFFDDEIESLRTFNPDTQQSTDKLDNISIKPFFEFITDKEVEEIHFGKQKYLPNYIKVSNISNYLDNPIVFFKDYEGLKLSYSSIIEETLTYREEKDKDFKSNYMFSFNEIIPDTSIYYYPLNNLDIKNNNMIDFNIKTINNFNEDKDNINKFINENIKNNKTVIICLKKYQIRSILKYLNMKLIETTFDKIKLNQVNIIENELNSGFIYKDIVVLSAHELFRINEKKNKYHTKFKYATTIGDINKLNIGDYVVHNIHGIGV